MSQATLPTPEPDACTRDSRELVPAFPPDVETQIRRVPARGELFLAEVFCDGEDDVLTQAYLLAIPDGGFMVLLLPGRLRDDAPVIAELRAWAWKVGPAAEERTVFSRPFPREEAAP